MCVIVDNDVRDEVFGHAESDAGKAMLGWLTEGKGRLVVGGHLLTELAASKSFLTWARTLQLRGRMTTIPADRVEAEQARLARASVCESNDLHVVALARTSGARLLFTNDEALQRDFKNTGLISTPRGNIYTTGRTKSVTRAHRDLLRRTDLCRSL